jgi:GntR family transcriptional regulator, arabinose operon transcriptional repressor
VSSGRKKLRYHTIREAIRRDVEAGRYRPGERLPSDAELAGRFDASRLTVIRALRELEQEGMVQRRAGSGTFVRTGAPAATRVFGILMPDLGDGEVFEPIAQGIARAGELLHHRLLWGSAAASGQLKEQYAEELCRYFASRKVAGVFFAPVELTSHQDDVNRRITDELAAAGIPIVLVDRCVCRYPERSRHDLVGIDNHRAGYRMTRHLLDAGCRKVAFGYRPGSAPTVDARMAGYFAALRGIAESRQVTLPLDPDPEETAALERFMEQERPDGIVCANDLTAARLMHKLLKLGVRIPEDVRLTGINDVKYAGFLPVPLTTLRQPCQEIGAAAMAVMLDRLENPNQPVRDVLLECELVVRYSCGAAGKLT